MLSCMSHELWSDVDSYLCEELITHDRVLSDALARCAEAELPAISVTANMGKFLNLLAQIHGSRSILEIGTLGGYSTIWLARALPAGGRLITLEFEPKHAAVASLNVEAAGLSEMVDIRVGRGVDLLPHVVGPFDFVFIDADKRSNPDYFEWAMKLTRPGSIILIDNTVRGGAVLDSGTEDLDIRGVRRVHEMIKHESRVSATALQTVGSKGYDGFTLIRVL